MNSTRARRAGAVRGIVLAGGGALLMGAHLGSFEALREAPEWQPVFSELVPDHLKLGLETVYEAYLVHYGRPRLFDPPDADEAVLLGDYLYAHGLVRIAATGSVEAVHDLAELISLCAQARAEGTDSDWAAWSATAAALGAGVLDPREVQRLLPDVVCETLDPVKV